MQPFHVDVTEAAAPTQQPDMQSQLMREMQQQQLMLAVSQCNQQLMMQQFDMATLHRQLQQLTGQMSSLQQASSPSSSSATTALLPGAPGAPDHQPSQLLTSHHQPYLQPLSHQPYLSPLSSSLAAHVPNNVSTSVNVQSSRQTTFTVNPNFTSNPFTSDPQRFPVSQAVQTSASAHDGLGNEGKLSGLKKKARFCCFCWFQRKCLSVWAQTSAHFYPPLLPPLGLGEGEWSVFDRFCFCWSHVRVLVCVAADKCTLTPPSSSWARRG